MSCEPRGPSTGARLRGRPPFVWRRMKRAVATVLDLNGPRVECLGFDRTCRGPRLPVRVHPDPLPSVKAELSASAVVSTAVAADTVSITIMEAIDNVFIAAVPGHSTPVSATRFYGGASPPASRWPSPLPSSRTGS